MLLFNSHRLLLYPPTNVGHQTVVGDDAQWCKVFVRITYKIAGYIADMILPVGFEELFALFSQVRPVHRILFFKTEVMGFNLGIKESPFRANWCMEAPKELLGTLDGMLIQHRLLATQ